MVLLSNYIPYSSLHYDVVSRNRDKLIQLQLLGI